MRVAAYTLAGNGSAGRVVPSMAAGIQVYEQVDVMPVSSFYPFHVDVYDVAVFWGYVTQCQNIMTAYRAAGKHVVYLDAAYWDRMHCFKVVVDARHPNAYFRNRQHQPARLFKWVKVQPQPWKQNGRKILIAGMSEKSAWAEGFEPMGFWETQAVEELKKHTDRHIAYRPKRMVAPPIPGTSTNSPLMSIGLALEDVHAVVTHHSNVAVDALLAGVPVFVWDGVAKPMGLQDLSKIEDPCYPGGNSALARLNWAADVAYCQWSLSEMRSGACWHHLREEGLV